MSVYAFTFNGAQLVASSLGVLYWPEASLLCVSDLHLGKSDRVARRRGVLLPPYESRDTLARLEQAVCQFDPARVICLGDSFDDVQSAHALDNAAETALGDLMAGRSWIWIAGNHDPDPTGLGGRNLNEFAQSPLVFRHEAQRGPVNGEISGHYHPKAKLAGRGSGLVRRCFLGDRHRLILPAFGTYTGGLNCTDPAFDDLIGSDDFVILTGTPCVRLPRKALGALANTTAR